MRECKRTIYKSMRKEKQKLLDDTHPLSYHPHTNINKLSSTYAILPIICNNYTMEWHSWYKWNNLTNLEV